MRRLLPLMLSLAATAALAPAAHAAPDWTLGKPLLSPDGRDRSFAVLGYDAIGTRTTAYLDVDLGPKGGHPTSSLFVKSQKPGEPEREELRVDTNVSSLPGQPEIAVAPSGAAVLAYPDITFNNQFRIRVAYRPAGGDWEPSKVVTPASSPVTGTPFRGAKVAIGADGTAAVVAASREGSDPGEFQEDTRLDVSVHPPGGDWSEPQHVGTANASADFPAIGLDDHGGLTVAYTETYDEGATTATTDDLHVALAQRRSATTGALNSPETLMPKTPASDDRSVDFAVNGDGRAVALWQHSAGKNDAGTVVAAVRPSASGQWGQAEPMSLTPNTIREDVAVAPDGTAYALLEDGTAHEVVAARKPVGAPWSAPRRVSSTGLTFTDGSIAMSGNDALMAWQSTRSGGKVVQGARWPAGAAEPEAFTDLGTTDTDDLRAVTDRQGGAAIVMQEDLTSLVAAFDGSGPLPTMADVPEAATVGTPVTMRASFADLWSPLQGETAWDFGDGATATGASVSHAYASAGRRTVTARSRDALGNERARTFTVDVAAAPATAPAPATPSAPAPVAPRGPRAATDAQAPKVTLALPACKRSLSKKACVRLRRSRTAWRTLHGTVTDAAPSAGIARVEITGTVGRKRFTRRAAVKSGAWSVRLPKLTKGRWTFSVRAVDRAGHASKPATRRVRLG